MAYVQLNINTEDLQTTGDGTFAAEDFESVSVSFPGEEGTCDFQCSGCGEGVETAEDVCGECPDATPEPVPFSWINSASIDVDERYDEVILSFSVGDPRGGISMRVFRATDGSIMLSIPDLERVQSHMHYASEGARQNVFILTKGN